MILTMGKAERQLYLRSAHDTTLLPLLISLGHFDGTWPRYCADLAVELWEGVEAPGEDLVVRVVYNGELKEQMSFREFKEKCASRSLPPAALSEACAPRLAPSHRGGPAGGSTF